VLGHIEGSWDGGDGGALLGHNLDSRRWKTLPIKLYKITKEIASIIYKS
jgi:hypothetical protein